MSRPIERIDVVLEILAIIWKQPDKEDMRLGQLIENCGIAWNTEDDEAIKYLCEFGNLPIHKYLLWGTRGKDGKSPLTYKKLVDLETSHLEELLKVPYCNYKDYIKIILNERADGWCST